MAKRNLAELVGQAVADRAGMQSESTTDETSKYRTTELPEYVTTEVTKSTPKYLQLVRKDTRLREDQLADLTDLARRLSRRRHGSGERITENTLIRVAVDLLLSRRDKLEGNTEDDLLRSARDSEAASMR